MTRTGRPGADRPGVLGTTMSIPRAWLKTMRYRFLFMVYSFKRESDHQSQLRLKPKVAWLEEKPSGFERGVPAKRS